MLKYFLEIAKNGNMTRAAEILHVVQPTLSKQIQDLEEELGRKLFTRSRKGLTLTEEGMIFKQRAAEIVALADKTAEEFKSFDERMEVILNNTKLTENNINQKSIYHEKLIDKINNIYKCY